MKATDYKFTLKNDAGRTIIEQMVDAKDARDEATTIEELHRHFELWVPRYEERNIRFPKGVKFEDCNIFKTPAVWYRGQYVFGKTYEVVIENGRFVKA